LQNIYIDQGKIVLITYFDKIFRIISTLTVALSTFQNDQSIWDTKGLPKPIQENENIIFVVREDLVLVMFKFLQLLIVFLGLLLVRTILVGFVDTFWMALYDLFFFSMNALLILYFTLYFHNYYLSMQIVTNLRVIDIEQNGLFTRKSNQLAVKNIENVTYKQNGLLASIFNYGDVIIETAGEHDPSKQDGGFIFNNVPKPAEIVEKLKTISLNDRILFANISAGINAQAMKEIINRRLTNNND